MDYSKLTLAKRTRLQEAVFFREYNEEKKKKKKAAEKRGDRASGDGIGGRRDGDSCDRAAVEGGESRSSANSGQLEANGVNVGVKEGFGSVFSSKGENSGTKNNGKSKEGSEKNRVVPIDGEPKKIQKGLRKDENVGRVDLKKKHESRERVRKSKIVDRVGSGDDESDSEVEFSGVGYSKVVQVDSRKTQKSSEKFKKNKNVVEAGADGDGDGDGESDDEVKFLRIDYSKAIEVDAVVESAVVDSSCSSDLKDSKEPSSSQVVTESNATGSVESVSDSRDSESESSSDEESEGSSDQDYVGSSDVDSDDSSSSGKEEDEDENENENQPGDLNEKGRKKMSETRSLDRKGNEEMVKVGLKRGRGKSPEVVFLGQARVDGKGEELNGSAVRKEGIVEGDGKQEIIVNSGSGRPHGKLDSSCLVDEEKDGSGGLKRMKFPWSDILVGCNTADGKEEEMEGPTSVAERLRWRRRGVKKKELGSFSCPFTLTDEELDSSSSGGHDTDGNAEETGDSNGNDLRNVSKSGEKGKGKGGRPSTKRRHDSGDSASPISVDTPGDAETCFKSGNNAKYMWESSEKAKGKVGRPAKRLRGCADSAAPIQVEKILADSIWEKGDLPVDELVSSKVTDQEPTLPLKFRFLDEDPDPPEKSDWDIEADKLFAEMDFVLAACEIGASDSSMVDDEDSITEVTESDPATSCRKGKHQLVLDEQIGLKCKFCSFVKLEIKHILPSFSKHPWGRPNKNYFNSSNHYNFDELQFQDSASIYQSNSKNQICAEGTVWDIIPGIKTSMYPHQREGFEFIWKNIGGSIDLEELKKCAYDDGSGCIISHAPGTGKTRLAIVFLQTFMKLNPKCMPVIIAPRSMLLTWEEEFKKWKFEIPFHNLNKPEFSGQESETALNLLKKVGRQGKNMNSIRLVKLYSWKMEKSILGISYRLFEKLAEKGIVSADEKGGVKRKRKCKFAEAEQVRKMLLEFPSLLVLDEGHTPRNDQSLIWRALSGVETQRRIILSGTPFQNNFDELFNTLCLARPKFSDRIVDEIKGDSRRKRGKEGRKGRGKWASLTNSIGKDTDNKLDKLRAMIDPFVHVHKGSILKESLPGLRDALVVLHPTDLQKSLTGVVQARKNSFKRDHLESMISVHPSLLLGCDLLEREMLSIDTNVLEALRFDLKAGVKTNFLMELIRLSMALKEKVLVFSQYIEPLTFLREQMKLSFDWTEGKEMLYMDGKIEAKQRQSSISLLNDLDSEVQVLLASTKACSEGISLVGASRVVLLDVVWNPSVERQAISRAYRIGQKKVVYIYRLITSGTREGEKCVRQAEKNRLSEMVFSSADGIVQRKEIILGAVNDDKILQEMVQHKKISSMFEKILNQPKESTLIDTFC